MMTTLVLIVCLIGGIADSRPSAAPIAARRVVEQQVGPNEQVAVDTPYYFLLMGPRAVVKHENDRYDSILRYSDDTRWHFPVEENGSVIRVWCISRRGNKYQTCGAYRPNERMIAFLKYRNKLKKGYELADLTIFGCGRFWVVHKDFVAKEFIPVDKTALATMTGRAYRRGNGSNNPRRYGVTRAVLLIRKRIRENDRRISQVKGFEPIPMCEPMKLVNDGDVKLGKVNLKVVDPSGLGVRGVRVIIDGFDEACTSRNGVFNANRVAPGRHDITIAKKGYEEVRVRTFPVQPGADTTLTLTIRRSMTEIDAEGNIIKLPNDNYRKYPKRPNPYSGQPVFSKDYRKCLPPVNELGLEFSACFDDTHATDTTYISVVASVRNFSSEVKSVCGSFSFITNYRALNYPLGTTGSGRYRTPYLRVATEAFDTAKISCEVGDLRPEETAVDTLLFQYRASRFEVFWGEMQVRVLFNYGTEDDFWGDSQIVDLGTLLIPIGRPSN
jgi:hypothetical protein